MINNGSQVLFIKILQLPFHAFSMILMKKNEDNFEASFAAFCKAAGLRKTIQRRIIYRIFYKARCHLGMEDIMAKVSIENPELRPESVYRILSDFERGGYIRKVQVPGVKKYEYASEKHGHFLCSKCGRITDVDTSDIHLPSILTGACDVSITFNGICPDCAKKNKK